MMPTPELRHLIREGFEQGIAGEKLAEAARVSPSRARIRSATGDAEPAHRLFIAYDRKATRITVNRWQP
jgi:hypothetical protein